MPQTLNDWVKQQEIDTGTQDGLSTDERERIKSLEREVKEMTSLPAKANVQIQ